MKIFIDPSHGGRDLGKTVNGWYEKDITLAIGLKLRNILRNRFKLVQVLMSRTNDKTLTIAERASKANKWGANFVLSLHVDLWEKTKFFKSYRYRGRVSNTTFRAQSSIHRAIVIETGWADAGLLSLNHPLLRQTTMPAIITECPFVSQNCLNSIQQIANAHMVGLSYEFNLEDKSTILTRRG
ncbi:N-acetylmuramoyl-L-alanine amidase [Marinithermofilum abyssi]|uniref:N-acetylmuramoyl-L-alanine amidase n=1 Tax=Marinithermofilum abyssi TaxID=1571185 RepID=UPI00166B0382|nr:N-acetylmuramoyl-L-alanine amidase [Marinithermofilum abyssi]